MKGTDYSGVKRAANSTFVLQQLRKHNHHVVAVIIKWNTENSSVRGRAQGSGRNADNMKQFRQIFGGGSVNDVVTQTGSFVFYVLFNGKTVKSFRSGVRR